MYDLAIIGAGIVGASVAYILSQYDIKTVVIEKEDDVAKGATRANSAIIHAGYDPTPGSLMARSNVRGSVIWQEWASSLQLEYIKTGSLVVAKTAQEDKVIRELYKRGIANGVAELSLISAHELKQLEPNLKKDVYSALYAKTAAIVNPYQSCIAFCEYARRNNTDFLLNSPVIDINPTEDGYDITTPNQSIKARFIVNAAGINTEEIYMKAGGNSFGAYSVKGEYYLLDRKHGDYVNTIVFPVPSSMGKGVVVSPTVHGNLLVGPTAIRQQTYDDRSTTIEGHESIRNDASLLFEDIPFYDNIRNFAGNRAYIEDDDFLVCVSDILPRFINMAGIKSPGLSSAPALAEEVVEILKKEGLVLERKTQLEKYTYPKRFALMSEQEQKEAISKDASYGKVVCRCETVTEGDIKTALESPLTPPTISAVKRRVNAGMGRCQGGFCSVRVHELISEYMNIPWEEVTLDGNCGYIVYGDTKRGGNTCENTIW